MDNNYKDESSEGISLKEILLEAKELYYYLLTEWKIIVLVGLIGASIGLIYSFVKKPVYTATLSFALEDEKTGGGLGGALSLASSFGIDLGSSGGGIFTAANLTQLFKSRRMVEKTLMTPVNVGGKEISLAEMYIQANNWRDGWDEEPKLKNIQFLPNKGRKYLTRDHDSILGVIYKDLSENLLSVAQKDVKGSIISVDVVSTNEMFSLYFCESLARQVGKFYVETKSKKARLNMEILKKQTDSIRLELNSAITGVAIANDNTFMLNPALNIKRAPTARKQVDVQANSAILTELVKQLELSKVALRNETPLIQVIDRPILPLTKMYLGKIKGFIVGFMLAELMIILFLTIKRRLKTL